jgi:hypothetical protein
MTARAASRSSSRVRAAYSDTASVYAAAFVCKEDIIPAADPLGDRCRWRLRLGRIAPSVRMDDAG